MSDEMQGVETTAIAPELHNLDSAVGDESHATSGGVSEHHQRETRTHSDSTDFFVSSVAASRAVLP
jgi:hypothetical protein